MQEPPKELISEWKDSPVTKYLNHLLGEELKTWEKKDMYFAGEPNKTQEALLSMIIEVGAFQRVQQALEGDFSEFSIEDEDEPE